MDSICIFLGSNAGNDPLYMQAARETGLELAKRNITCVYGGSCTGMMNELADSVLDAGGKVIGVTVQALKDKEQFHKNLTELHVTPTMHERKKMMIELSDGFIALPGGIGTYEEFFEVYTLKQLGFHSKPCGLLNVNDFYHPLELMMSTAEREGFLKTPYDESVSISENVPELFDRLLGGIR
ncbi:TIGR00730 family Rossman fold protein [Maridesulfovibrio sp.]|uniref:LOG family protein n=1 Tax=unclassified Maridesulfovibrio TaxID=2794999 RepID=UPI003AFFC087